MEDCAYKRGQSNGAWRGRPGMNHAGFLRTRGSRSSAHVAAASCDMCVHVHVCVCACACVHVCVCMCLKYLILIADAH